ncbi:MAG: aminotransferase class I/II-fold pyridoxal phosphate-dependent enzyme [Bacteroidales bacterium]|nr:aminotransferase class I/II-fold pyridoxal phosphate-dependent enzyme [Bacteroidales bacterium]
MIHGETMKMWNILKLGYSDTQGLPELREEIAGLYRSVKPEDILVLAPEEGIFISMNTLLEKGDEVITTYPGYQSLYEVARSLGCHVKFWKPRFKNGWNFEPEDLEQLISNKTKLLVINFPNNPTGSTISKKVQQEIVDLAKKNDTILYSDEMYQYLEYEEENRLPSVADLYEKSVTLFGMSKTFALAGLRIGWLITKNHQWLNDFQIFRDYTTICNSAVSEILAIMGLKAQEQILRRNHEIIRYNLKLLNRFFTKYDTLFDWYIPKAGPIAFPRLKGNIDANEFCKDLLKSKGVMLLPPEVYDFDGNHFRIGFARRNMPEALNKLEEYIEENSYI